MYLRLVCLGGFNWRGHSSRKGAKHSLASIKMIFWHRTQLQGILCLIHANMHCFICKLVHMTLLDSYVQTYCFELHVASPKLRRKQKGKKEAKRRQKSGQDLWLYIYTVIRTLAFLYQLKSGFSPFFVSVSSTYAHLFKKSSCDMTFVSLPVTARYISSITVKSVGNNISKYP